MPDAQKGTTYQPGPAWSGRSSGYTTWQTPSPADPACQPCPDCGGLECLCRPRFFAGQLLSEQDLNRFENYILAKNRLHNRYLVGWGVVCGLEVRCNPCGDVVTVTPGYALSPCGDDIIVCKTDTVDVCSLITKCSGTIPDCQSYSGDASDCADVEPWILAIRYEEKPARGITALTGGGKSTNCCACGKTDCSCGSANTNCGCTAAATAYSNGSTSAGTAATARTAPRAPRNPPPACEPTLICEGYRYVVFRPPTGNEPGGGEMFQNMLACFLDLISQFQNLPSAFDIQSVYNNRAAWTQWCCNVKQALINQVTTYGGGYDCEVVYNLQAITCPATNLDEQSYYQAIGVASTELVITAFEVGLACICSIALPPCHDAGDPRVPLALVNVRRSDCSIVSVCNWIPQRRNVVTFVTLRYWLGWLPFGQEIRAFMQALCCNVLGLRERWAASRTAMSAPTASATSTHTSGPAAAATGGPASTGTTGTTGQDMFSQPLNFDFGQTTRTSLGSIVTHAIMHNLAGPAATLTTGDLGNALFQPLDLTLPSSERLAAQPAIKVLSEIIRPLTAGLPPALFQSATTTVAAQPVAAQPVVAAADVAAMRTQLAQLQETVQAQQADITAFQSATTTVAAQPVAAQPVVGAADVATMRTQLAQLQETVQAQQADITALKARPRRKPSKPS
jgi:hypothetical protein